MYVWRRFSLPPLSIKSATVSVTFVRGGALTLSANPFSPVSMDNSSVLGTSYMELEWFVLETGLQSSKGLSDDSSRVDICTTSVI